MTDAAENPFAAPCGLYCGACTIYLAGKRGDTQLLEQMAQVLEAQVGHPLTVEDLACDGCMSTGRIAVVCQECVLRTCAVSKPKMDCKRSVLPSDSLRFTSPMPSLMRLFCPLYLMVPSRTPSR